MKYTKKFNIIALASLIGLALVASGGLVTAHGDESGSGSGSGDSVKSRSSTSISIESEQTTTSDGQTTSSKRDDHRRAAKERVEELRKDHKSKSAESRKKTCESRKQGLINKFSRIVTNSERIQARIDGILDKAIAYQASSGLEPENFASLVETAQTAKATSLASITELKAVQPSLDCNNVSVSEDVATFKAAAATTRDNLKEYKKSVKAVLKSLKEAKQAETETTESTEGSTE